MTQIFHNDLPGHGGNRRIVEVTSSTKPLGTLSSTAVMSTATLYQGNRDQLRKNAGAARMLLCINGMFTIRKL